MPENKIPYLCGGVMFFLLKQAVLPNVSPRDHKRGISDDHSEPIVMGDLIHSFTGSKNYGAGKDTSYYKECTSEGSINVPFNDIAIITAFDNTVRERYLDALDRMSEFVATHFNPEMKTWFVKAILEIIENDSDISENQEFFICEDGSFVSKEALRSMTEFKLQPFMVGVLHFILKERRNKNCLGAATLDTLGDKKNRKARVYTGKMGEGIMRSITVSLYEKSTVVESVTQECGLSEMSDDEVIFENLKKPLEIFASALEAQKHQMAEQIRTNKKTDSSEDEPVVNLMFHNEQLNSNDSILLQNFRNDCEATMIYIIEHDPAGSATKVSLLDEIEDIIRVWKYAVRKVENNTLRKTMQSILQTLRAYTEYLSDLYLRHIPDVDVLYFRNESFEEGERLREVLQPKTYELRKQTEELYRRLFPMPEDDDTTVEVEDDEQPSGAADAKKVVINSQTNIGTQTVNNFDIKDSKVTFNL